MTAPKTSEHERIRELNDTLRKSGIGGTVMLTHGIASLPQEDQRAIMQAVQQFDSFTGDNDPYGEHDCALVETDQHSVLFKIDYYNPALTHHSDDPTDPEKTMRVLTIMLPEEH